MTGSTERATDTVEPHTAPSHGRWGPRLLGFVERYALVVLLLLVVTVFTVHPATSQVFPTTANFRNIAANESVLAVTAFAALIPLVSHRFDLSVGGIVAVSSIVTAQATTAWGFGLVPGMALGVGAGAVIGAVNGAVIAVFRAHSLVITLGMSTLLAGVGTLLAGHVTIVGIPEALPSFGNGFMGGVPLPVLLFVAVALLVSYILGLTLFGRRLRATGVNESAATLVGMPVTRTIMVSFVASGMLAGVAGVLLLSRTGSAAAGVGEGYTLPALAAIFLGSTTIRPGQFTVIGTIVGVFFVAVAVNGLTLAGTKDWVEPVFNGTAVVVAVSVSALLARRRASGARTQ